MGVEADGRSAASVVVLRGDAVLMVLRARPPFAGVWSFPGGRCEPGEDLLATARRELAEETGLALGAAVPIGRFQPAADRSPLWLTVFAACGDDWGEALPIAGDDAADAAFVPLATVLERPTTPGAVAWIARAIAALEDRSEGGLP